MSWGFSQVVERATKIGDDVANSEFAWEVERALQRTGHAVDQGITEVASATEAGMSKVKQGIEKIGEDLQPTLATAEERTHEFVQSAAPRIQESLFSAMSSAAKTAIWFQSLGSHSRV